MHTIETPSRRKRPYLYSPYVAKAQRLLLGEKTLADVAHSSVELAPATRYLHPAPLFEATDLHRITGVGGGTTIAHEQQQTIAGWRTHEATTAHRLRDLFLIDGGFYAMRFKHGVSVRHGPLLAAGMAADIEGGVLGQSWLGERYFGHWLLEDVTLGLLAGRRGDAVGIARNLTRQQREYAQFFHYRVKELPPVAYVKEIEILSDSGLNAFHINRLQSLRELFADPARFPAHNGVFLMRGATGESRQLLNENEVADFLQRRGFQVINPGAQSMEQVRAAVANAQVVVGVEGSHLAPGVLGLASGGGLLVLQPPSRFNNAFKDRCDLLGLNYSFLVCDEAAGGFRVNLNALARLMDRLLDRLASPVASH